MVYTMINPFLQTRDVHAMLAQCRASVTDGGPTPGERIVFAGILLLFTFTTGDRENKAVIFHSHDITNSDLALITELISYLDILLQSGTLTDWAFHAYSMVPAN